MRRFESDTRLQLSRQFQDAFSDNALKMLVAFIGLSVATLSDARMQLDSKPRFGIDGEKRKQKGIRSQHLVCLSRHVMV